MMRAALLLAIVIAVLLVGCAAAPPAEPATPRTLRLTCGIVNTGKVPLSNGRVVPAMQMVCEEAAD